MQRMRRERLWPVCSGEVEAAVRRNFFPNGEGQPDTGSLVGRTFNINGAVVASHHSVNHRQSQTCASAFGFGGEKGFQAMLAGFFIHAHAVIPHFNLNLLFGRGVFPRSRAAGGTCGQGDGAALGKSIHRIKIKLINASRKSPGSHSSCGNCGFQFALNLYGNRLPLRKVAPARTGQFDDLFNKFVDVHLGQILRVGAAAVKFPHARDNMCDVFARLDG